MDHSDLSHPDHGTHIDPRLLEILVCPLTKSTLIYDEKKSYLISKTAHLIFPIRNGIPILALDEAEPYDDALHDKCL